MVYIQNPWGGLHYAEKWKKKNGQTNGKILPDVLSPCYTIDNWKKDQPMCWDLCTAWCWTNNAVTVMLTESGDENVQRAHRGTNTTKHIASLVWGQ